ncbi:type II and III secretion system protein family protein [Bremerella sp. T1]|uniref:type II and III secretion system protein family protein n=1 Tax=Bremerella sp. TYQ1 TaxID=3119568 RepID=UPI001CCFCFF2|nr:pilus assembly protein N-terminal domain-containing protein [Bremerella volcania]UBM36134.1 pilus assembly protein N-terminal domain-containing protein [Bremerella volcania]
MKSFFQLTVQYGGRAVFAAAVAGAFAFVPALAQAQIAAELPSPRDAQLIEKPNESVLMKESNLIQEVLEPELIFRVEPSRSKILKTKLPMTRVAITSPDIVEINEFSTTEVEVIGLKAGETTMTIWFAAPDGTSTVLRYLVKVAANDEEQRRAEIEYGKLEARINELFPNSIVQLIPVADKLIVRGQARDAQEAAQILAVLGGQSIDQSGNLSLGANLGSAALLPGAEDLRTTSVIDLLQVPGEQQVMLKVRIAELQRTAARNLGFDFSVSGENYDVSHIIGAGAGNLSAILDGGDVELFLQATSTNGMAKILAEPTLVTISGKSANFIAGGEFAVPTAVGVGGIGAVSTTFRGFGTQLAFTPTVLDKDKIRLQVAPSFSSINSDNTVDGIPGLDMRGVTTTVDLREGQWLAVAGLIQDEQQGSRTRLPGIGDIPLVGAAFGRQSTNRTETELVVLVSPELVHPMEVEQLPLFLPGTDVTDPTNKEFFWHQQIEGRPGYNYRSTVWPAMRHQIHHENHEILKAQRHARKASRHYHECEDYYISGPQGFSN